MNRNLAHESIRQAMKHLEAQGFVTVWFGGWDIQVSLTSRAVGCNEVWRALDFSVERQNIRPDIYRDGSVVVDTRAS